MSMKDLWAEHPRLRYKPKELLAVVKACEHEWVVYSRSADFRHELLVECVKCHVNGPIRDYTEVERASWPTEIERPYRWKGKGTPVNWRLAEPDQEFVVKSDDGGYEWSWWWKDLRDYEAANPPASNQD